MPRTLTPSTSLETLKKEARRRLKALRSDPSAPVRPVLRDVQHAIAREYGFAAWKDLKAALASRPRASPLADRFLEFACPDHHVRSRPAHEMAAGAAMRLLAEHPELAAADLYTAVVAGEIDTVDRILRDRPALADARRPASGPDRSGAGGNYDFLRDLGGKPWTPLLFLAHTRLPLEKSNANAVAIARLLLDRGADPNAFFMAGASHYTPLSGVIGEGEENRPPHPLRDELVRLLLERGAEPYDQQVIYNLGFRRDSVLWWLRLMHEFSLRAGRAADWADPEWRMLTAGPYGSGARWHLRIAVRHNDLALAQWCLAHGATADPAPETSPHHDHRSLYEQAVRLGHTEIAELLARHGAPRVEVALSGEESFLAAALRLDRDELARHPEFLRSHKALFEAARRGRADVAALLLDLGTPVDVQDEKEQRALHVAAWNNSVAVAKLLIERGAEIDHYERNYTSTPIDFALWFGHREMFELLAAESRDVWSLTPAGKLDRLREVLAADPGLAKISWQTTPLFWLPADPRLALEAAQLFLDHGADPAFRSKVDGSTAAELARRRGLHAAADLLDRASPVNDDPEAARHARLLADYQQVAQDVLSLSKADDEAALDRLGRHFNRVLTGDQIRALLSERFPSGVTLSDARDLIARQSGYGNWAAFLTAVHGWQSVADDYVRAFEGDAAALDRLNTHYDRRFTRDDLGAEVWRRNYAYRQRSSRVEKNFLKPEEAQLIVAQDAGFSSWDALLQGSPAVPAFHIRDNAISPRRRLTDREWDDLIGEMREHRIAALHADGLMTDRALARLAGLDHVTTLDLSGSRELTDDGLLLLARMPQIEKLVLNEYPGGRLTDRGLEVLRHLPNLREFEMTWQAGITDAGVSNLRFCDRLERVDLMGSPTGDGAAEAIAAKPGLRSFSTGRLLTDAGLAALRAYRGPRLLIDGPFTDGGLAHISGLEQLADLDLFWHCDAMTSAGYTHLARLPNLQSLGCDGRLSDDAAMAYIASMPSLRNLRAQESAATEEGFVALARSRTLEAFWGRKSEGFGSRSFAAFSKMPSLRRFGVDLSKVGDEALARFADFPALRELTPMGLGDEGFRHVGRCAALERLTCMYCRESGDLATEHIASLSLKSYYAGLTQITDRSLEILGRMVSLEKIELYECKRVTDAGLAHLVGLPNLREAHFDSLPGVTLEGTKVFPKEVKVYYST